MLIIEAISMMSKSGCDDEKLLNYIFENYDRIECELNGTIIIFVLTAIWH